MNLYTPDELWEIINNWDGKIRSKAIIKGELSKIRLAVASNIEMYIHESYLMYLSGHIYKDWYGITLDQNVTESLNENIIIRQLCKQNHFVLPFDYAAFDHQVTTEEVKTITKFYYDLGLKNVIPRRLNYVKSIISKTVNAYGKSTLEGNYEGKTKVETIHGGLPSGIRTTSLIGNIWNAVLSNIVKNQAISILNYNPIKHISIRGDDSLIICEKAQECYLIRILYLSVNAIGHSNKFAILRSSGEFLRNHISKTELIGWTNRSIPSIVQRKPWNPEPWEENHQVTTIKNNIDIIERRSKKDTTRLHDANKIAWSKITKLSTKYLHLPKRLGGIGIYDFKGFVTNQKLPKLTKTKINFTNLNNEYKQLSWIQTTEKERKEMNNIDLEAKVVADDIPGFQAKFHRQLMSKYSQVKPFWKKTKDMLMIPEIENKLIPTCKHKAYIKHIKKEKFEYKGTSIWEFLTQYNLLRQVKEIGKLTDYLKILFPDFYLRMKYWEKKGWHRTDAINISLGDLVIEPTDKVNSQLTEIIKQLVWKTDITNTFGRNKIATKLSHYTKYISRYLMDQNIATYFRY